MTVKTFRQDVSSLPSLIRRSCGSVFLGLLLGGLFTSCTDKDDHFDADASVTASQKGSLWANIEQNAELSDFASLLKKTGYDAKLNQAQTYTVWAPKNGTFDYDVLSQTADDRLVHQFVENHIARNNYPASGEVNDRVYMLNKKVMTFASTADGYTMQGVALQLPSIGSNNGTMHIIDNKIPFLPNIYESLNNEQFDIGEISDYFHSYDTLTLNEQRSVQGPAVDGEITYLDAIYDEQNELFYRYHAYINREDSSYTMLVPTNTAWEKAKKRLTSYYNYPEKMRIRTFIDQTDTRDTRKDTTITINAPLQLQDSLANVRLLTNLTFNNRIYDNGHLSSLQTGDQLVCDSLVSTWGAIISRKTAADLFIGSTRVDKSNGAIFVTDSLRLPSWFSWCPPIKIEAESAGRLAFYGNTYGKPESVSVTSDKRNKDVPGTVSQDSYLEVIPSNAKQPTNKVAFFIPGVMSATYRVYVVVVPNTYTDKYATAKSNKMKIVMNYSNTNATSGMLELKEETLKNGSTSYWVNDASKVDTLDLGDVTFPHCYRELGSDYAPYISFESNFPDAKTQDGTLRLDCIMLIPKELDEYMKANPGYKLIW